MENKNSQNFGGENAAERPEGIFSRSETSQETSQELPGQEQGSFGGAERGVGEVSRGEELEAERFVPENLKDMGEGALEGLNELSQLPMPETPMPMSTIETGAEQREIQGGGVIAADGESDARTERGVDALVERAEASVERAKREHNLSKMQEEKIALGREVIEMMRGNGGVQ